MPNLSPNVPSSVTFRRSPWGLAALLLLSATTATRLGAQTPPPTPAIDSTATATAMPATASAPAPVDTGAPTDRQNRRNFDPAAMRERMMTAIRTTLGVEKDDEWLLIQDRLNKVMELRRGTAGNPLMVFRILGNNDADSSRMRSFGGAMSPETSALVDALHNQAPDAEIKTRLAQLRDARKRDEAQLTQAQEDLRAVLTVRQEAIAVAAGLLP
ncbi:MAG: hypothetical protein ACHQ4G_12145 [Opitutales bacterium]